MNQEEVDQKIIVSLPTFCPYCGSEVDQLYQYDACKNCLKDRFVKIGNDFKKKGIPY